jgi:hypothetical protein
MLLKKDESLNKAEKVIRKLQSDTENSKRAIDMNESQMKQLRE